MSPNFASSYTLGSIGLVDGSLSYLYTSRTLDTESRSGAISLRSLVPSYRHLQNLRLPVEASHWEQWRGGRRVDRKDAMLYGRLFLPNSTLEAMYLRRLSPKTQLKVSCVSDSRLSNGGTLLAHLQYDAAKHCTEYIYSTDGALLGVRGLYNFGSTLAYDNNGSSDTSSYTTALTRSDLAAPRLRPTSSQPHGRFSVGGEVYYGLLNKSGGISTGLRFSTLPSHTGFPYTMTLTLNPLMGSLSGTYSVCASPMLALSSRFDFNVYSYESELQVGTELWRRKPIASQEGSLTSAGKESTASADLSHGTTGVSDDSSGCAKARIDQRGGVAILWEGRIKELLYTCGMTMDLRGGENMFRGVGVEVQYSP